MDITLVKRVLVAAFGTSPRITKGPHPVSETAPAWEVGNDYLIYEHRGKFCMDRMIYHSGTHIDPPETVIEETGQWRTLQGLLSELCKYIACDRVHIELECIEFERFESEEREAYELTV